MPVQPTGTLLLKADSFMTRILTCKNKLRNLCALIRSSTALIHICHRLRPGHIAGFDAINLEASSFDHCSDRPIEVTATADARPDRRQPVLPSPYALVRRQAMFHEQEPAARPKYAAHFGERGGGLRNAAKGPGRH